MWRTLTRGIVGLWFWLADVWRGMFGTDLARISSWLAFAVFGGALLCHFQTVGDDVLAMLVGFACLVAGGLVGFLFGIPRVLQSDAPAAPALAPASSGDGTPASTGGGPANGYRLAVNTNLEQISDWLTKIIVGVGLIELKSLPGKLNELATQLAIGLGSAPAPYAGQLLALGLLIYFPVLGFIGGYLLTRLFLAGVFRRADQIVVGTTELSVSKATEIQSNLLRDLLKRVTSVEQGAASVAPERTQGQLHKDVLWVDDNPPNNSYLVAELEERGVRVTTALSTSEGLRQLSTGRFSFVITDMTRTEDNRTNRTAGLDLIRAIRERDKTVPIIVHCSAPAAKQHGEAARAAGANEVTSSPTQVLALAMRLLVQELDDDRGAPTTD